VLKKEVRKPRLWASWAWSNTIVAMWSTAVLIAIAEQDELHQRHDQHDGQGARVAPNLDDTLWRRSTRRVRSSADWPYGAWSNVASMGSPALSAPSALGTRTLTPKHQVLAVLLRLDIARRELRAGGDGPHAPAEDALRKRVRLEADRLADADVAEIGFQHVTASA